VQLKVIDNDDAEVIRGICELRDAYTANITMVGASLMTHLKSLSEQERSRMGRWIAIGFGFEPTEANQRAAIEAMDSAGHAPVIWHAASRVIDRAFLRREDEQRGARE
jgi:hypothetical protein